MQNITNESVNAIADKAHEIAKQKGFWDDRSEINKSKLLLLILSEISELVEGQRALRPKVADLQAVIDVEEEYKNEPDEKKRLGLFGMKFVAAVKDTWQDELADTFIRILDFARGYGHEIQVDGYAPTDGIRDTPGKQNELYDQLFITSAQIGMYPLAPKAWWKTADIRTLSESALNKALCNIMFIAERHGVDLEKHVEYKMKYNALRDRMNGKQF